MPSIDRDIAALERRLGHAFSDRGLLERALTHRSAAARDVDSNERLEFLGDRVIGLAIAELVYSRWPEESEGGLNKRLVSAVRAEALAEVAQELGIGQYLRIDRGEEEQGGRANPTLLADACEAVIAAIYLDAGLGAAQAFVQRNWSPRLERLSKAPKDAKTGLQEWAQARALPLPEYVVVSRSGPDHSPHFVIEVRVRGLDAMRGEGGSKRLAEQAAARALLGAIGGEDD